MLFQHLDFKVENSIAFLTLDVKDQKVNILTPEVCQEISAAIHQVESDLSIKALIIQSNKNRIFIAGADIKEIESIKKIDVALEKAKAGQDLMNRIEDLKVPSVALINGVTLGGGLELALSCTYRISGFDSSIQIGLPEVRLGIIPGFGGTVRMPKVIGFQNALTLIIQGKALDPQKALRYGLVDDLAPNAILKEKAIQLLEASNFKKKKRIPNAKGFQKILNSNGFGRKLIASVAKKAIWKRTLGNYPAPLKAIDVMLQHHSKSREEALLIERKGFSELIQNNNHTPLITCFYLMERHKKERWVEESPSKIDKCAVIGAGVMGGGIAQTLTFRDIPVRLKDIADESLLLGLRSSSKIYQSLVKRRRLNKAEASTKNGLISPTLDYKGVRSCDVVIEAVVENMKVKQAVFQELDEVTREDAILASNTSSLSISEMASVVKDPSRVIGMHFFNPVHRMPLVEIIRGDKTSDKAVATIVDLTRRLKKTPLVVKDSRGFLVNRILLPFLNEAGYLAEEGIDIQGIDKVLLQFGMPMGAFVLLDEIGLDVGCKVAQILEEAFGARMKVSPLLENMLSKSWLGKKSQKGFYIHQGKKRVFNEKLTQEFNLSKKDMADSEIIERTILVMINEASYCLQEEVCREAQDVDLGMMMGTGFPPFRGGLLRYADQLGADKIVSKLESFQEKVNADRFKPSPYLIEMKKAGRTFHS